MNIVILGGGIAGISASYHLKENGFESTVYEKNKSWGGLCDNFLIGNNFLFDTFVHLSFTDSEYVQKLFSKSSNYLLHKAISSNYYKGFWLKHPAQNNLAQLSTDEKVKIIIDFVNKPSGQTPEDYYEWLILQFGEYFTNNFPRKYTLKYWTVHPKYLSTDWLNNRFSLPSLDKLLKGAFEVQEENFYYAQEMRYPISGGYKAFLNYMADHVNFQINKTAILIDTKNRRIDFSDGTNEYYEKLISSIPLPELVKIIKDAPPKVKHASGKLWATSGQLVSFGFDRPDIPKNIWFYIYDEEILPARAYSPSIKSPNNVPDGKSSLQFETYFSKNKPARLKNGSLIEHIVEKCTKMGLFSLNDIEVTDYREISYANVVFDFERESNLNIVHKYLDEIGVSYIGRFGEWDYLWSDQSLLSGKKKAEDISNQINK